MQSANGKGNYNSHFILRLAKQFGSFKKIKLHSYISLGKSLRNNIHGAAAVKLHIICLSCELLLSD